MIQRAGMCMTPSLRLPAVACWLCLKLLVQTAQTLLNAELTSVAIAARRHTLGLCLRLSCLSKHKQRARGQARGASAAGQID